MKTWLFSTVLALGLAVAISDAQTDTKAGRVDGSQQPAPPNLPAAPPNVSQPSPAGQLVPPEPVRRPSSVIVKPSGVLNKPSGVLNKPSGVLNKPSGVISHADPTVVQPPILSGQNFMGRQTDVRRFGGDFRRDGNFRRGDFRHGRRSSFIVVYVNGAPCWYPVYTAYPYYYDARPAVVYDNAGYVPLGEEGGVQAAPSYGEVGRQWGQDLRRDVVAWDQFVDYLRVYIINADPAAQADFREAFIASYGINGAAAYDKAADQAAQTASSSTPSSSQGPKIIDLQSAK